MQPIDITGTAGPLSPKSIKSSSSDDDRSYDTIMTDGDRAVTPIKSETEEGVRKVNRLGRACDPCSIRKTKCDQGKPCGPCSSLDIPCTFDRPKRRRGPPNRLAEAIKREHEARKHRAVSSEPASAPTNSTQGPSAPSLTAESIGPIELVEQLVDDFFTFLWPLGPFPHEPTFREKFRQRRDRTDKYFLAQLAAMVGALVAVYPRLPRRRLKSHGVEHLFPSAGDFIQRCLKIATEARGGAYMLREDLSADDAATSYCLFAITGCGYRVLQADMYAGETYNILLALLAKQTHFGGKKDMIEQEMIRRIFWALHFVIRASMTFGATLARVPLNPPSLHHQYPPLPQEVDDEHISVDHIESQPPSTPARVSGFIHCVRLMQVYDPLVKLENAYEPDRKDFVHEQMSVLKDCIVRLRDFMPTLPETLTIWRRLPSRSPSEHSSSAASPRFPSTALSPTPSSMYDASERLEAANEVQKANIYITYLSTRSYFVEKYYNLLSQQHSDPQRKAEAYNWIRTEREAIALELLEVLRCIRPIHLEPNSTGASFKIRAICSTLMPDGESRQVGGETNDVRLAGDSRMAQYLQKFLEIISALERGMNGPMTSPAEEMDRAEEEDLRAWASLREHQRNYAQALGGVMK